MGKRDTPIDARRLRRLLRDMIDIYSPSGKEGEVLAFVGDYLREQRFSMLRQPLDDYRYNLLLLPPEPIQPTVLFIGHLDTVAAYDLENFACEEDGDRVRGLGAADMKGGCAAMIEAFVAIGEAGGDPPPAGLALVVGEEEDGDGTARLLEDYHFPWAIIGEPTNLQPCLSHSGYMEVQIRTRGRRQHASLANHNENAVGMMLHALLRLMQYFESQRSDLVVNIRDLFSSQAGFVVPDRCESWLDLHMPPTAPVGEIATDLEDIFTAFCRERPCGDGTFRITTIDAGYELPHKGPMVAALRSIYDRRRLSWQPDIFRSHSDAGQIWAAGMKPILLGPGRLEDAHIPEESVSFRMVAQAAQLYADLLLAVSEPRSAHL